MLIKLYKTQELKDIEEKCSYCLNKHLKEKVKYLI